MQALDHVAVNNPSIPEMPDKHYDMYNTQHA